jgi:hypothetical protein
MRERLKELSDHGSSTGFVLKERAWISIENSPATSERIEFGH